MTSRRNHKKNRLNTGANHEGSWAVSYVDMLTVVLCFFIVFFNSDKSKVSNSLKSIQQIRAEIGGKNLSCDGDGSGTACGGRQTASVGGRTPNSVDSSKGVGGIVDGSSMGKIFSSLMAQSHLNTQSKLKNDVLEIEFNKVSFFESGSKELTAEGRATIDEVMKILKNYKDSIRITVQGHTDSQSVVHSKKNAADNWELSVIRATSVLKMFKTEGFPQSQLSAEGFADTKPERELASVKSKEDLAKQRRITLRVEELKHEK